ncbi:260_t:CDS:2, partial [Racocetra persica]
PKRTSIELSNQDNKDLTNPDFQTYTPLSDIQTNSVTQTCSGIYGPENPHLNAIKKKSDTLGNQLL